MLAGTGGHGPRVRGPPARDRIGGARDRIAELLSASPIRRRREAVPRGRRQSDGPGSRQGPAASGRGESRRSGALLVRGLGRGRRLSRLPGHDPRSGAVRRSLVRRHGDSAPDRRVGRTRPGRSRSQRPRNRDTASERRRGVRPRAPRSAPSGAVWRMAQPFFTPTSDRIAA